MVKYLWFNVIGLLGVERVSFKSAPYTKYVVISRGQLLLSFYFRRNQVQSCRQKFCCYVDMNKSF